MIHYKLDPSTTTVVGICREPECGVRALSSSMTAAREARDAHEELCHMTRGRQTTRRRSEGLRTFPRNSGS